MPTLTVAPCDSIDGRAVKLYTLRNDAGLEVRLSNFGGAITHVLQPDARGVPADVVLGFDSIERYAAEHPYLGVLVGRVAGRIQDAAFELDGETYRLHANDGVHHLHGGARGFSHIAWDAEPVEAADHVGVRLRHRSPDGDEGYPGTLDTRVAMVLTSDNVLRLTLHAETDRATLVNLTHHAYWNFAGHAAGSVAGHTLQIDADDYTPSTPDLIPTGKVVPVDGTPLDLREPRLIGDGLAQLPPVPTHDNPGGYDDNYVVRGASGTLRRAARVRDEASGRGMEVWITQPCLQFYTSNFMDGSVKGKGGVAYAKHAALCLEPQHAPDSQRHPAFEPCVLRPGDIYEHMIEYRCFAE